MKPKIDFKILFESLPGLFIVLSPNLKIMAISNDYLKITSVKKDRFLNTDFVDLLQNIIHVNTKSGVTNFLITINQVLLNKSATNFTNHKQTIILQDGTPKEERFNVSIKPVLNSKNEINYLICSLESLTDLLEFQTEQIEKNKISDNLKKGLMDISFDLMEENNKLKKSKVKNRISNDNLKIKITENRNEIDYLNSEKMDYVNALDKSSILSITDNKGIIIHVNENFCKLSKYTENELLGSNHRIINSGHHSKAFFNNLWRIISSGTIWKGEIKNKAKDGSFYWVDSIVIPFIDSEGKPFKYVSIRTDITENKKLTEEIKSNEERFKNIYNNTLVAMYSFDLKKLKPVEVNSTGYKLFGYKSQNDFLENFTSPNHMVNIKERGENIKLLLNKGKLGHRISYMKKKDGSFFWAKIYAQVNSEKTIAECVVIDVTNEVDYKQNLEKTVAERTAQLDISLKNEIASNELKSKFVAIASHEFRTPLTAIATSASLIKMYEKSDQQKQRLNHVNIILSSVKNLTSILNDFLSIEQIEKGYSRSNCTEFNLPLFLSEIKNEVSGIVHSKKQKIIISHAGENELCQCLKLLKNILLNLISNASKYSEIKSTIHINSSIINNVVNISVKDEGLGIGPDDQARLFETFFRAKNVGHIEGTGLGLHIVKKYVELMDGSIHFKSKLGVGSVFTIEFPQKIINKNDVAKQVLLF